MTGIKTLILLFYEKNNQFYNCHLDPKGDPKGIQRESKGDPKGIQRGSKGDPKGIQRGSKGDPKGIKNGIKKDRSIEGLNPC
jgi:hypothetical protein